MASMGGAAAETSKQQSIVPWSHNRKKPTIQSKQLNSPINNLMDCLLTEILQRLPDAKSIIRCKFVSKQWLALISSPHFIQRFLQYHIIVNDQPKHCNLIIYYFRFQHNKLFITWENPVFHSRGFNLTYLPCYKPEEKESVCVVASCNDLLLCCATMKDQSVYYICNPFTMHWIALPPTPKNYHDGIRVGFICEPYLSSKEKQKVCCYTINPHYKYKVVRIPEYTCCSSLEMFSSETNKWSECEIYVSPSNYFCKSLERTNIVGCNGMLHWFTRDNYIAAYNPYNNEQSCFIDYPAFIKREGIKYWGSKHCLGVYRGILRILRLTKCCNMSVQFQYDHNLSVWELKDYNTSNWSLEYDVFFNEMISKETWVQKYAKKLGSSLLPQAIHPNDGDIVYLALRNCIILCNLKEKELKVAAGSNSICDVFPIVTPWWPTPVPTL